MLLLDSPIQTPPVSAKTYPIVWIYNLSIQAHDPNGEGSLVVELLPMSTERELHWKDGPTVMNTNELYRAMSEVPELSAAFAAILAAVKPTQAWIAAQEKPAQNG